MRIFLDHDTADTFFRHLENERKVNAIKLFRQETGLGLKESKFLVDIIETETKMSSAEVLDDDRPAPFQVWYINCETDVEHLEEGDLFTIYVQNMCTGCVYCQPEGKKSFWSWLNPFNWFK